MTSANSAKAICQIKTKDDTFKVLFCLASRQFNDSFFSKPLEESATFVQKYDQLPNCFTGHLG